MPRLLLLLLTLAIASPQELQLSGRAGLNKRDNNGTVSGRSPSCPLVWNTISKDLTSSFVAGGQCTDLARTAIRFAFHDAATFSAKLPSVPPASGGADGSLLLNPDEINRGENAGLQDYYTFITGKYAQYKSHGVSAADLVQFAGSHGIVSCPGGPTIRTLIGRQDSSNAAPEGLLPKAFGPGSDHDTLFQLFLDKGFGAVDLAALIGAHTSSRAFATPPVPVGTSQDSSPGVWDVRYYSETYKPPPGVSRFDSDVNLSNPNTTVGKQFQGFVDKQDKWAGFFAPAMFRMSLLGLSPSNYATLVDCTAALPRTTNRRSVMAAPINFRAQ